MKHIVVLGSTGSIGCSALEVIEKFPDRFTVVGLAAGRNIQLLAEQIKRHRPPVVAVLHEQLAKELAAYLRPDLLPQVFAGPEGYRQVAAYPAADTVLSAIVGAAGLLPTLAAVRAGKNVALANKEALVMAGALVMAEVRKHQVQLLPVDSEHSAIFQALEGQRRRDLRCILLTASGGPFIKKTLEELQSVTPAEALAHPNWSMGAKITIDSATLMNKGLEVIEARWLFGVPMEKIKVYIHPQSIVHSMVEYVDGSVIAQMGLPDMRGPIGYALAYPERLPLDMPPLDLAAVESLTFREPDTSRFPCLELAFAAGSSGGTMPAVLNAANEVAVQAFLAGRIAFTTIAALVERTMAEHTPGSASGLEAIMEADSWARRRARELIEEIS